MVCQLFTVIAHVQIYILLLLGNISLLPVSRKSVSILNRHVTQDTRHLWQEGLLSGKGFFQAQHCCLKGSLASVAQRCGASLFLTLIAKS